MITEWYSNTHTHLVMQMTGFRSVPSADRGCHSSTATKGEQSVKHNKASVVAEHASPDI